MTPHGGASWIGANVDPQQLVEMQQSRGVLALPEAQGIEVVSARRCLWSLRRLWVAVISRHSDLAADLPLRNNRSVRRLNLMSPKTGSIIAWHWR